MVMFTQAFRYALNPLYSRRNRSASDDRRSFSDATKFFIIFGLLIFLVTTGYIDIIKKLIPENYHVGLKVVPIVLLGELSLGSISISRCGKNSPIKPGGEHICQSLDSSSP
jgi:hypothetical protein